MFSTSSFFVAACGLLSVALGAPIPSLSRRGALQYQAFGGDGTMRQGWPAQNQWLLFDELWALNEPLMRISCQQFGAQNNDAAEITQLKDTLLKVSKESGLDKRFLLAIMMQESKGCVRAPTTNYGHNNPGLFQSFEGKGTCNDGGNKKYPCPQSEIEQMVRDGSGMTTAFGLLQALDQSRASDDSKYYKGARIYNSGHIAASGNLGDGIATHCYASDIANRLVGWPNNDMYPSSCNEGSIQGRPGGNTAYAGAIIGGGHSELPPNGDQAEAGNKPPTDIPNKETAPEQNNEPTGPKIGGASANCKSWYTVKAGDGCHSIPVTFSTLRQLNPSLDATCSNLWLGYAYCTSA